MTYAGDVSVKDCWMSLETDPNAQLVDVRTSIEWQNIGVPDLSGITKEVIFVEWQSPPLMQVNPSFVEGVVDRLEKAGVGKDAPVYMLCRSGVRSISAAMALTAHGYSNAYNVLHGFEGDPDATGQRGRLAGWQFDGLPVSEWSG